MEPTSPQPSVDRLSVTFAAEERSVCSDSSTKVNVFKPMLDTTQMADKVRFSRDQTVTGQRDNCLQILLVYLGSCEYIMKEAIKLNNKKRYLKLKIYLNVKKWETEKGWEERERPEHISAHVLALN